MDLDLADVQELDDDDDQQYREDGKRNRGALAEEPGADAQLIGVSCEELGGIGRPSTRQYVDKLKVGEGLNHRKQDDDQGDRQKQWPRHMPKALPRPGAVDRRGLMQFGADRLQAGEQADRVERQAAPDVDD